MPTRTKNIKKSINKITKSATKFSNVLIANVNNAIRGKQETGVYKYINLESIAILVKFINLVKAGKYKNAMNLDMDSSVRESIPNPLYDMIWVELKKDFMDRTFKD